MKKYPTHLLKLIEMLRCLPGVGSKSAERFAFDLIGWPQQQLSEMATLLNKIQDHICACKECGSLSDKELCAFCLEPRRQSQLVCVVASQKDVFALENTHEFHGLYHVLGNLLSPLEGRGPEQLSITPLKTRIAVRGIKEVVIALDSTLEGDATALYLKNQLEDLNLTISRLAFGLPMGSSLDYVDGGTLARALAGRRGF